MRRQLFLIPLLLALFFTGCDRDTQLEIARANHRIANALEKAELMAWGLHKREVIDKSTYLGIASAIEDVAKAGRDFNARAASYPTFTPEAKADLLMAAEQAADFIRDRIQDGSLHIKNEEVRQQWLLVAEVATNSFASIVLILEAAKPVQKGKKS